MELASPSDAASVSHAADIAHSELVGEMWSRMQVEMKLNIARMQKKLADEIAELRADVSLKIDSLQERLTVLESTAIHKIPGATGVLAASERLTNDVDRASAASVASQPIEARSVKLSQSDCSPACPDQHTSVGSDHDPTEARKFDPLLQARCDALVEAALAAAAPPASPSQNSPIKATFAQPRVFAMLLQGAPHEGKEVKLHSFDAVRQEWLLNSEGANGDNSFAQALCLAVMEEPAFSEEGDEVVLQGLMRRPDLNGRSGRLGPFIAARKRWRVSISGEEVPLLLQSSSLRQASQCHISDMPFSDPIEVRNSEACGTGQQGMFATKQIGVGSVIFEEEPIFVTPTTNSPQGIVHAVKQFLTMSAEQRESLLSLHAREVMSFQTVAAGSQRQGPRVDTKEAMMRQLEEMGLTLNPARHDDVWSFLKVFLANAFDRRDHQCVYLWTSRVNHSCEPNAIRSELDDNNMAVVAVRPISAGEEICISYASEQTLLMPSVERQRKMMDMFGFSCRCEKCLNPEVAVRAFCCRDCAGHLHVLGEGLSACTKCGGMPARAEIDKMLKKEAVMVDLVNKLENKRTAQQIPISSVDQLLKSAQGCLAEAHWVVDRLHSLAYNCTNIQREDLAAALRHQEARLRFFDTHLTRPSLRRGIERGKLADCLSRLGRFQEAFDIGCIALAELKILVAGDRAGPKSLKENPCTQVRRKLGCFLECKVDA